MFLRLLSKPLENKKSFFLFGPRGTGKTTWLKHHLPQALFINLLQAEFYTLLLSNPSKLRSLIPPGFDDWIILDEVQRVPALLNEVHDLIESKGYRFVLTGSSARTLRRAGVNLLAGRALTYHMHPVTAVEQEGQFKVQQSLQLGHLPARFSEAEPTKYLKDYVQTYLREEVMQEGLTRNMANFSRFLEVASFSQGETISVSELAREAHIERSVADNYFSILEDLLIAIRLPVFSRKAKRKLMTQKKFYYFDVGVFRAIRPQGPLDSVAEMDGPALETLVLQEIRAINDYFAYDYQIYYWRTKSKLEVDFVLYGPNGLLAIEVKRSNQIQHKETRALREFKKDYPPASCYVFYGGSAVLYEEDVTIIPISQALLELPKMLAGGPD
jgi:predicted AAA+ superfamily ATPase